jgi:hypothetical protein
MRELTFAESKNQVVNGAKQQPEGAALFLRFAHNTVYTTFRNMTRLFME